MKPNGNSGELMYVKCSYCGEWLDVKPGNMNLISHSVCPKCLCKLTGDQQGISPSPRAGESTSTKDE